MKLTAAGQTSNFFEDPRIERFSGPVGISFTGGTESSLLLYLLCKYEPQREIVVYTGVQDDMLAQQEWYAEDVMAWIKEQFPNNKINDHIFFHYNMEGRTKTQIQNELEAKMLEEGTIAFCCNGTNLNPPIEEMKAHGMLGLPYNTRDPKRDQEDNRDNDVFPFPHYYKPFINVDKLWTSGMYEAEGLTDTLLPLTHSCTGLMHETDWGMKPCGLCFSCLEKKWAFGTL